MNEWERHLLAVDQEYSSSQEDIKPKNRSEYSKGQSEFMQLRTVAKFSNNGTCNLDESGE